MLSDFPGKERKNTKNRKSRESGTDKASIWRFRIGDAVVIALAVCVSLALIGFFVLPKKQEPVKTAKAQVWQYGQLLYELPLNEDTEKTVTGLFTNVITVKDGKVFVSESDCPGKDCVHMGSLDRGGWSIVCLPNRMEIIVTETQEENPVDSVVR